MEHTDGNRKDFTREVLLWSICLCALLPLPLFFICLAPFVRIAIGGPDISLQLQKIRVSLINWYTALPSAQQAAFSSQWVTSVAGLYWDLGIGNGTKVDAASADWDIVQLEDQIVATPTNSGVLLDGEHTVTVYGHVYKDQYVNYWLYGVLGNMLGWNQEDIQRLIIFYRDQNWHGTGISGRITWTLAGWNNDLTLPDAAAIKGIELGPLFSGVIHAFAGQKVFGPVWSGNF